MVKYAWTAPLSAHLAIALAALTLPLSAAAQSARSSILLAEGWQFKLGDDPAARDPKVVPDGWSEVSVPHTWNRVGYTIPDTETRIHRPETVNKTQGIAWYRLTFTPPAGARGQRAWLQFDAASRTAEVWLNGQRLGEHRGGFSRFRLDATGALRPGASNLLVVKVDNTQPKPGASTADVLPLTGDFFIHGGLYRPVSLILTDPVHIDMLDFGGPGVYATTRSIRGKDAEIEVRTRLRNDGRRRADVRVTTQLIDADGKPVAGVERRLTLTPAGNAEFVQALNVAQARLWQGVEDPYLYTVRVAIRSASGQLLDSLEQPFGIRQMRLDPEKGFVLNDKPLRLHGVGFHQDREGKGWAKSEQDVAEDVALIREMGANTIRLTHYQHGQPIHDLADRYGLVVWDEIPLVTAWTMGDEQESSPALLENARQQLRELIRQNFNHASVAVWGIANEVDFGANRPDFLGTVPPEVPDPMPLLRTLDRLAKSEDPSRPTVLATCCDETFPDVPATAVAADGAGANRYFGWYYGQPQGLGPHLDKLHAKWPNQPLSVSEYGAGSAITIHTDDPLGGPIDPGGPTQPEEYASWLHEESWRVLKSKPYLWATWLWNGFDFASTARREGDSQDVNTKGLVTYDRKVKKDPFYFYKANWSSTPTVYITGRRYADRAYAVTDVRVYSNAPSTELTVNGRSLGAKTDCPDRVCIWPVVRLRGGNNELVATGAFGTGAVGDRIEWRLDPEAERTVRIDSGAIVAAPAVSGRFGSDAFFEGGSFGTTDKRPGRYRPPVPAAIAGTQDRDLLATYREGEFHYRVPVENGPYVVTLTFVEPAEAKGARLFDVLANGSPMLSRFDVVAAAGSPLTAVRRSFDVKVRNGLLDLQFRPVAGKAIVSAIEISPAGKPAKSRK